MDLELQNVKMNYAFEVETITSTHKKNNNK